MRQKQLICLSTTLLIANVAFSSFAADNGSPVGPVPTVVKGKIDSGYVPNPQTMPQTGTEYTGGTVLEPPTNSSAIADYLNAKGSVIITGGQSITVNSGTQTIGTNNADINGSNTQQDASQWPAFVELFVYLLLGLVVNLLGVTVAVKKNRNIPVSHMNSEGL